MVVLRDGEWSVWCPRCPWRSRPAVTFALAQASRHCCGSGGRPAAGGPGRRFPSSERGWSIE
jgi:hypothetical protein